MVESLRINVILPLNYLKIIIEYRKVFMNSIFFGMEKSLKNSLKLVILIYIRTKLELVGKLYGKN